MSITTVAELIAHLEDFDPDAIVRIAHQPSWPLAEVVGNVTTDEDADDERECPDHEGYLVDHDPDCAAAYAEAAAEDVGPQIVWIVAGGAHHSESPYAPRGVFG